MTPKQLPLPSTMAIDCCTNGQDTSPTWTCLKTAEGPFKFWFHSIPIPFYPFHFIPMVISKFRRTFHRQKRHFLKVDFTPVSISHGKFWCFQDSKPTLNSLSRSPFSREIGTAIFKLAVFDFSLEMHLDLSQFFSILHSDMAIREYMMLDTFTMKKRHVVLWWYAN